MRGRSEAPAGQQHQEVRDPDDPVAVEIGRAGLASSRTWPPGRQQQKEVDDADCTVAVEVGRVVERHGHAVHDHRGAPLTDRVPQVPGDVAPIVGDVRGAGYFYGVELVKDKQTKARFETDECKRLFRDFLSPRLFELGLMCRVEDKQDPVIQLAPPLIAGPEEFAEIGRILRQALSEAWERMG